ncbi:MAG TPA: hypothetical protein VFO36_10125 [Nitrospiraceae bacterium]|nr:hypothetical protein [Nitrospiraceae bacterium]
MSNSDDSHLAFDLASLPAEAELRSVTARSAEVAGRSALRVELTDAITTNGQPGVDYVDMPTFAIVPTDFRNGSISVDILSRLNDKAPDYARAFAGIAYRITDGGDRFEAVYLRPLNGMKVNPPSPRDKRAIQYFAYPEWKFDRLREEHPDGLYEAGADIGPDEWITLRLEIDGAGLVAFVNERKVLTLAEAKVTPMTGRIGLWVDVGTEAYFANLRVTRTTADRSQTRPQRPR